MLYFSCESERERVALKTFPAVFIDLYFYHSPPRRTLKRKERVFEQAISHSSIKRIGILDN